MPLVAVWFGLASGLLELACLVGRVSLFERGVFVHSPQFVWMVPVSGAAILTASGLILGLATRFWPTWGRKIVVGGLVMLMSMSVLLVIRGLSLLACVLISAGIARMSIFPLMARWPRLLLLMRRSLPALAAAVIALIGFGIARDRPGGFATPGTAATADVPTRNVILIVLDTVRADHLSLHGYHRDTTPNLVRLARLGVRFDQARSTAPWTLPSHASMFTGRWASDLDTEHKGSLDAAYPTIAEYCRGKGLATIGVVANQFFCGRQSGLARGFDEYKDFPVTIGETFRSSNLGWLLWRAGGRALVELRARLWPDAPPAVILDFQRKDAADVNREFLGWLSSNPGRPFFAFLNYFDAHDPYIPPGGIRKPFGLAPKTRADMIMLRDWQKLNPKALSPEAVDLARDAYDDCLASLDAGVGRLLDELARRGVLENSVVIITADHGEQFGEHGKFRHAVSVYGSEVHVPLVIIAPSLAPAGKVVRAPASLRDLASTIVDLMGAKGPSPFPGQSLAHAWNEEASPAAQPFAPPLSELTFTIEPTGEMAESADVSESLKAIVEDGKSYIHHSLGREELYDLEADPFETHDLAHSPGAGPILERLRQSLQRVLADIPVPRPDTGR